MSPAPQQECWSSGEVAGLIRSDVRSARINVLTMPWGNKAVESSHRMCHKCFKTVQNVDLLNKLHCDSTFSQESENMRVLVSVACQPTLVNTNHEHMIHTSSENRPFPSQESNSRRLISVNLQLCWSHGNGASLHSSLCRQTCLNYKSLTWRTSVLSSYKQENSRKTSGKYVEM